MKLPPVNIIDRENHKNKFLLIIFIFLLLLFVSVIYFAFLRKPKGVNIYFFRVYKEVKIDFSVFDNPLVKELNPYNPPALPEKKLGSKNPFFYTPPTLKTPSE